MTDELIKEMARRFLQWKLPSDFAPDGGITFESEYLGFDQKAHRREPVGTNLFTAAQAEAMIRHMIGQPE